MASNRPRYLATDAAPRRGVLDLVARAQLAGHVAGNTMTRVWRQGARMVTREFQAARQRVRGYDAAAGGRNSGDWNPAPTSANAEIGPAAIRLRSRARELARNNPIAIKVISELVTATVGTGLVPKFRTGNEALDKQANELWQAWVPEAQVEHGLDVYGMQAQMVQAMIESGEVFLRRRWRRPQDGLTVPLQVQILEADFCPSWMYRPMEDGGRLVQGIDFDPIGRRRNYLLYGYHPGDMYLPWGVPFVPKDVPASEIAHLFVAHRGRPGQVRGVPWLTGVAASLHNLEDYKNAEQLRKKIESCLAAVVLGNDEADEDGIGSSMTDQNGDTIEEFEPGMIAIAHNSKDIRFNNPTSNADFPEYKRTEQRDIAAGALVPFEAATGDLSQTNYSSIRYGTVGFRAMLDQLRTRCVIPLACDPIADWFVEAAQVAGKLPYGPTYTRKWSRPRREEVDRVKETTADIMDLAAGLATMEDLLEAKGIDYDAHMARLAKERADRERLGLVFEWGKTGGILQVDATEDNPDETPAQGAAKLAAPGKGLPPPAKALPAPAKAKG